MAKRYTQAKLIEQNPWWVDVEFLVLTMSFRFPISSINK